MNAPTHPDTPDAALLARALKASGDELRLLILTALARDSFGVLELCTIFACKQSGMSHHLKVLANAGLVATRREGNTIFYRRSDEQLSPAHSALRHAIYVAANELRLPSAWQDNLAQVYGAREDASRAFFLEHARAFKEHQDLIATLDIYGPEVAKVIDASAYRANDHALEIGPGTGEFLPELATRFTQVTALDNAPAMLEQSRQRCAELKLHNVELSLGDTRFCRRHPGAFDCVVINMVLHHTPSPQQIFDDVASALKTRAVLIICELAEHNQDWVRDACGDQWLGFASNDLKHWAENAGLNAGLSRYFALRNGFQIQIHQFIKP